MQAGFIARCDLRDGSKRGDNETSYDRCYANSLVATDSDIIYTGSINYSSTQR